MTRLSDLFDQQGQSPWLDNLTRPDLQDGTLATPTCPTATRWFAACSPSAC